MSIGKPAAPTINQFKDMFFDSPKVQRAVDRGLKKTLGKYGSHTRTRMKTSIKYAPKVDVATGKVTRKRKNVVLRDATSAPGSVPYGHKSAKRMKTNKKTGITKQQSVSPLKDLIFFGYDSSTKSVVIGPALYRNSKGLKHLEYGGVGSIRSRRGVRTGNFKARPFARPAGAAELPKFLNDLKDCVR